MNEYYGSEYHRDSGDREIMSCGADRDAFLRRQKIILPLIMAFGFKYAKRKGPSYFNEEEWYEQRFVSGRELDFCRDLLCRELA